MSGNPTYDDALDVAEAVKAHPKCFALGAAEADTDHTMSFVDEKKFLAYEAGRSYARGRWH